MRFHPKAKYSLTRLVPITVLQVSIDREPEYIMLNRKSTLSSPSSGAITLRDMITYLARRLVSISEQLESGHFGAWEKEEYDKNGKARVAQAVNKIIGEAQFLGLHATEIAAQLILEQQVSLSCDEVFSRICILQETFHKETERINLFFVAPEKQPYLLGATHCGEGAQRSLPKANHEVCEAAKCFAVDRYTACVFHLMRALECGLRAVAFGLGLPNPAGGDRNWGRMLTAIKGKIDNNNKQSKGDAGWQSNHEFYEKAYSFLEAARLPMRNPTMHIEADYDEQSALDAFNATTAFVRHLATKLSE
jgi:hypothetical protein